MRAASALLLALAALVCAGSAAAAWRPRGFLVGAYLHLERLPEAHDLVGLDEAGIDWFTHFGANTRFDQAARVVALADSLRRHRDRFALQALVTYALDDPPRGDRGAGRLVYNVDERLDWAAIDRAVAPGAGLNGPSALGWAIWDEPCDTLAFGNLGRLSRHLAADSATSERLAYTNLRAIYAYDVDRSGCWWRRFGRGSGRSKAAGYAAYLGAYLAQFERFGHTAPLLCFDHYPFQVPSRPMKDWFLNLRLVRDAARAGGRAAPLPFWVVVQLASFRFPHQRAFPERFGFTHTRWQVWSALAYGAKGIVYWGATPYAGHGEVWGPGLLGAAGDTVATVYSQVRALDRELHALGPTLMRLDPVACAHARTLGWEGVEAERFAAAPRRGAVLAGLGPRADSLLVGQLRDRERGDDYLLLVNKALVAPQTFRLALAGAPRSVARVDRGSGEPVELGTLSTLAVGPLAPGQGELYRLAKR